MNKGFYRDGISAEPYDCQLALKDHQIYIYFKGQNPEQLSQRLPPDEILIWDLKALESCIYSGGILKIVKDKQPGQQLECSGSIAKEIHNVYLNPVTDVPAARPKKVIAFFTLCALAIIGLGVLAYIYLLPWVAGKASGLVSEDLEIRLGNNLSEVYLQEGQLNDSATYYSNRFVKQLNLDTKYPIHIYVLESEEINAFAVPGGNIFVYTGLLSKLGTYEEYAALLSHEATHVIRRHSLKSILSSAASGILLNYFFGDISGLSGWAVSKADEFKQLDYSRDLETEADLNGLQLMIKNEVSPKGMLDLLKVLKKEGQDLPGMMKYFSTHPDTDARIEAVLKDPMISRVFPEDEELKSCFAKLNQSGNHY